MQARLFTTNNLTDLFIVLLAPWVLFAGVIFSDKTISYGPFSAYLPKAHDIILETLDPTAGTGQDEPWLYYIGKFIHDHHRLPMANLHNGLGTPLFANLQSGIFYPLNLLIPFLPLQSSQWFDIFQVLHVSLLSVGLLLLYRQLGAGNLALCITIATICSGFSSASINMVHLRVATWTPWFGWALLHVVSDKSTLRWSILSIVITVFSLTAGNPQESLMGIGAMILLVAILEIRGLFSPQAIITFMGVAIISGLLITPYLLSITSGDIVSLNATGRCLSGSYPPWNILFLIPRFFGIHPHYIRGDIPTDLPTPFHPLLVVIFVAIILSIVFKSFPRVLQPRILALIGIIVVGIVVATHPQWLNWCSQVPLINALRLSKYTTWIHLLLGATIALSFKHSNVWLTSTVLLRSSLIVLTSVLILFYFFWDATAITHFFQFPNATRRYLIYGWIGCILSIAISPVITRLRGYQIITLFILVFQSSHLFDVFLVERPYQQRDLNPHKRIFSTMQANTNLLRDNNEYLGMLDPAMLTRYQRFMMNHFSVRDVFDMTPQQGQYLNERSITALKIMGVTHIDPRRITLEPSIKKMLGMNKGPLTGTLPRFFTLSNEDALKVSALCESDHLVESLTLTREQTTSVPQYVIDGDEIHIKLGRSGETLVALYSYNRWWKLGSKPPDHDPFCGFLLKFSNVSSGEATLKMSLF